MGSLGGTCFHRASSSYLRHCCFHCVNLCLLFFQDNNGVIGLVEPLKTSKVPVKLQMVTPVIKIASGKKKKKPIFLNFDLLVFFFKVCFSFIKETTTWSWSRWKETCTHWAPESRGSWEELLRSSQTAEAGKALVSGAGTSGPTGSLPDT